MGHLASVHIMSVESVALMQVHSGSRSMLQAASNWLLPQQVVNHLSADRSCNMCTFKPLHKDHSNDVCQCKIVAVVCMQEATVGQSSNAACLGQLCHLCLWA